MKECQECMDKFPEQAVFGPDYRNPPVDEGACLCIDCVRNSIDDAIDQCEDELETLQYAQEVWSRE